MAGGSNQCPLCTLSVETLCCNPACKYFNFLNFACVLNGYVSIVKQGLGFVLVNLPWFLLFLPAFAVSAITYLLYILSCPVQILLSIFAPSLEPFAIPIATTFYLGLTKIKPLNLFSKRRT